MSLTFTLNKLIFYAYGEGTQEEQKAISGRLINDEQWQQQYNAIIAVKEGLDNILIEPSEACINRILDYSKTHHEPNSKRVEG